MFLYAAHAGEGQGVDKNGKGSRERAESVLCMCKVELRVATTFLLSAACSGNAGQSAGAGGVGRGIL
jgi:hypothetical protein